MITAKQAKEKYNVNKSLLDKVNKKIKIKGCYYYDEEEIEQLLAKQIPPQFQVTVEELCKQSDVSKNFITTLRNQDKIRYNKQGNKYIYDITEIFKIQQMYQQYKQIKNHTNAYKLVYEFYEELQVPCKCSSTEMNIVNSLLKKGYTDEEIKIGMTFLIFNNYTNLYKLSKVINDALEENDWYINRDKVNSVGYIVKQWYLIQQQYFIRKNFYSQCKFINQLLNLYSPNVLIQTFKYMQQNKLSNFNSIEFHIDKALKFCPQEDLFVYAKQKVQSELDLQKATEHFIYRTYYNQKLTKFEYAFLVNLPLNKDLIEMGKFDKLNHQWAFEIDNVNYTKEQLFNYLKQNGVNVNV